MTSKQQTFIKSPLFENWFINHKPKKSLLICTPYLKSYALDKIHELYNLAEINSDFSFDVLIRGKLEDFINGSSDISALESFLQLKIVNIDKIRRLTNLHMKAYLLDNTHLLIGSGNCTKSGLFSNSVHSNVEGSLYSTDNDVIADFTDYFCEINKSSESLDIFYDKIINEYNSHIDVFSPTINNEIGSILSKVLKEESKAKYKFREKNVTGEETTTTITPERIPQFSKFEHGAFKIAEILNDEGNIGLNFNELGRILEGPGKKEGAYKKYGENHAKLAELLDFVTITTDRPRKVYLTKLGKSFVDSDDKRQINILKTQIYRMGIIKDIMIKSIEKDFKLSNYLSNYLSITTVKRRKPNVVKLFRFLINNGISELTTVYNKF